MKWSLQVISSHSADSHPSLMLVFDSAKYLFNAGEGMQRAIMEHGSKLTKLKAIFVSRLAWDRVGGVPGVILTLDGAERNSAVSRTLNIYGPNNLARFVATTNAFSRSGPIHSKVTEINSSEMAVFSDENLTFSALLVKSKTTNGSAISWFCSAHPVRGKFDAKIAKALGIPPGPLFGKHGFNIGKLASGLSITLEDGRKIDSIQCTGPSRNGACVLFVECPDKTFIQSILLNKEFDALITDDTRPLTCVVHSAGSGVFEDARYLQWISRFHFKTEHIVFSPDHGPRLSTYTDSNALLMFLNNLDPGIFAKPKIEEAKPILIIENTRTTMATSKVELKFEPKVQYSLASPSKPSNYVFTNDELEKISTLKKHSVPDCYKAPIIYGAVSVTPLGTGASSPARYRNVSSTLIDLMGLLVLLDVGEGTLGQLNRHFGVEQIDSAMKRLSFIFISHFHADHHLGIISVIKKWSISISEGRNLCVVGPITLQRWLAEYSTMEDFGYSRVNFIESSNALGGHQFSAQEAQKTGISSFTTVRVDHCANAFAGVFVSFNGFKFSFSGDCRPSLAFQTIGSGSDLLIHEATFTNDMQVDAIRKKHSTLKEAFGVAVGMKCKNLLMTHFSQRYTKFPPVKAVLDLDADINSFKNQGGTMNVGMAIDLMNVKMDDFWRLQLYGKFMARILEDQVNPEIDPVDTETNERESLDFNKRVKLE